MRRCCTERCVAGNRKIENYRRCVVWRVLRCQRHLREPPSRRWGVLRRLAGGPPTAEGYRSRVRLCEFGVLFALKARLTTKAVIETNTSTAAVETAAAIIASV